MAIRLGLESERDRVTEIVIDAAGPDFPICVGTTHAGTDACIAYSRRAQKLGARAVMVASVLLVLIVELVNSAIEAAIDRISLENHRLSKRAKDIGSAAVLVALLNVLAVWLLVLL